MLFKYIITILLFLFSTTAFAQNSYKDKDFAVSLKQYGKYALLSFKLENGSKLYWRNPGASGFATKISVKNSGNLKFAKILWPIPEIVALNNGYNYVYSDQVDLTISVIAKNKQKAVNLITDVEFVICNDMCSHYNLKLLLDFDPLQMEMHEEVVSALKKTPKEQENLKITAIAHEIIDGQDWLKISYFSQEQLLNPKIIVDFPEDIKFDPNVFSIGNNEISIPFKYRGQKALKGNVYVILYCDNYSAVDYKEVFGNEVESYSFLWVMLYALLGGLILNAMPCVLPIVALKIVQLIKLAGSKQKVIRFNLLLQAAGIIFTFSLLSVLTYAMQAIGREIGFGFQFQQPYYLITMVIILSFIAISLFEKISPLEIILPNFILKFLSADQQTSLSFFCAGVLSTLLAIPCTAPFITIAVGFALTANFIQMLVVFSLMGLGMALPYIILSIIPKIGKFFPKPGQWMINFKKILAIVIFATSLWIVFILESQMGVKAAIILFLLVTLLKFVLIDKRFFSTKAKTIITIVLIFLSYYMPNYLYNEKLTEEYVIDKVWQEYDGDRINNLVKNGHIVFVDITASWCATCSLNKITTLNNLAVMEFFNSHKVIAMRGDISSHSDEKIFSLMKKHRHYGVPLNIIYSKKNPNGVILPNILTPSLVIEALLSCL
jgi:suppressor for copper-sensitivity B